MCRKPKIRAAIIRQGFGGPLYYNHNKEPPNGIGNYFSPPYYPQPSRATEEVSQAESEARAGAEGGGGE